MGFLEDAGHVMATHPETLVVFGVAAAALAIIVLFSRLNEELGHGIEERNRELRRANARLKQSAEETERKVEERTREIDENVKKLSNAEAALMNMISDLNRVNKELKSVDAMKDEFLNITTHELKTPITPIKMQAQLWLDGAYGKITPRQEQSFGIMLRNADRLSGLIDDLTTISKIQSQKMKFNFQKVRMDRLVRQVVFDYQNAARKKGITLQATAPRTLPRVRADEQRMLQVLANLVGNALKFTERGSIEVAVKASSDRVIASVSDTGIGIPADAAPKIFSKFFQADQSITRKYGGTGLGLAICKAIVEKHGGKIWFDSAPGKGTTFYVSLPRHSD